MSDPLDFPPSRPLPEGTRARARQRLAEGMAEPRRPSSRTPVAIAAAVVLLAGSGAVIARTIDDGGGSTGVGPTSGSPAPPPDLATRFHAYDGWAPPEAIERCAAAAQGLPARDQWIPLVTTTVHQVTLSAFRVGPDVFFCETTPASVSLSPLVAPDTGGVPAKIAFISANGSTAGFVRQPVRRLDLTPTVSEPSIANGLVVGDVFLSPETFRGAEKGVKFIVDRDQGFVADDLPQLSTPTVDRPRAEGDRAGESGRRLGACLDTGPTSAPDQPNWVPGVHEEFSATSEVQLGRYGDLLAVCTVRELDQPPAVKIVAVADAVDGNPGERNVVGTTIWGVGFFYDYQPTPDGGVMSGNRGFAGLITDDRVASIMMRREGFGEVVARIEGGTFILSGRATMGITSVQKGTEVIVRDATGHVLESMHPAG